MSPLGCGVICSLVTQPGKGSGRSLPLCLRHHLVWVPDGITRVARQVLVEGGWRNRLQLPMIAKLGIPIIHTWNLSVPMWEYHHGFQVRCSLHKRPAFHFFWWSMWPYNQSLPATEHGHRVSCCVPALTRRRRMTARTGALHATAPK